MQALIIGYVWPEPASSAAGKRIVQLLDFFLHLNYKVTFATPATPTPYMADLKLRGINTAAIAVNDPNFDRFLNDLDPELVMFDRFMMEEQFGWRVAKICPDALRILDTEDLHFLRKSRELGFSGKSSSSQSELAKREIASIYRCDLSLIISEVELELLVNKYSVPASLLFYLPFMLDGIQNATHSLPDFDSRKDFVCIGNLRHAPNVDAVFYLKDKIWPLIHKHLPHAKLHIYGAYSTPKIDRLHDPKNCFHIKGRAVDAEDVVKNARVSLVPLRFGAGLKGKLIEAMVCGTASVTTNIGAEGLNHHMPWNGEITDEPEEFAAAAIELYTCEEKWTQARNNGFKIINSRFSKDNFYTGYTERLKVIKENLEYHREKNFTGSMLMHHRLKSTWYLSKYIETKTELEKLRRDKK